VPDLPLLVFGPRSPTYDFGPSHPLTPRRFGPAIDLLRAIGAEPGLAPEPAADDELLACHTARYLQVVRRFSEADLDPWGESEAGIGPGDDPPFHGMHEAGAAVAGGSLRAMEAILRGDVAHAFHPGGGLHHAMPSRAAGFCIYNDVALAVARARSAGLRVLYVDLDVHHGDGVELMFRDDPGVLTVSIHESGRYLFPGTGFASEIGEGAAAGTVVNVPLEPETGEDGWLAAVTSLLPELAASFAPDVIVSQHGCDTHATDPLAHLNGSTTMIGRAARLVDQLAHRWTGGRWLATGGGGYGVYRVVPRAWSHVWLAGAHREPPISIPTAWRDRWAVEAARYGDEDLPDSLDDPPNAGLPRSPSVAAANARSIEIAGVVREAVVTRLVRAAVDGGWWSAVDSAPALVGGPVAGTPEIIDRPDRVLLDRLVVAGRVLDGLDLASLALGPVDFTVAVIDSTAVGIVASVGTDGGRELLAVRVAPGARRQGLAAALLERHLAGATDPVAITVTVAERDPIEPLVPALRMTIARRLLLAAGFEVSEASRPLSDVDPSAITALRR
jgi:acetoin utilization protein AcuC